MWDRQSGGRLANMPKRQSTVSRLDSLAARSPRSPLPVAGVEKCADMADFEPPAAIEHRERNEPLRQSATTRSEPKWGEKTPRENDTVLRRGERTSSKMARSLVMSAMIR
jgi:hypothetical protein